MSNEESHYQSASIIDKYHQNELVKPLSELETKEVLEEILGSYDKWKGSTKFIMWLIILSIRDIGLSDDQCKGSFENPRDVHFATTFIHKHHSMFMNNKNGFQPVNNHTETSEINIPTTTQRRKQPRRRLVPEGERMKKKINDAEKNNGSFPNISRRLTTSRNFHWFVFSFQSKEKTQIHKKGCGF